MSASHSLRCAFAAPRPFLPVQPSYANFITRRRLHPSPAHRDSKKAKKSPTSLMQESEAKALFPEYTAAEQAALAKKYSPAQLAAIQAGENAISAADLANQGVIRRDPMALKYVDDFSTIRPYIDHPIRAPEENYDPNLRFKEDDELAADLADWAENLPDDPDRVEWMKFADNTRVTVGKAEAELNPRSSEAPTLPKMTDKWIVASAKAAAEGASDENEMDPHYRRLAKQTGLTVKEMKQLRIKMLVTHRVVNQTRMGKVQSQYFLTVAGNTRGMLGIGEGKAVEVEDARRQATLNAIRNMKPIPRYEERTIYGDVKGKVGATELQLMTRPPGFGIRCQDKIYEMCKCAGISDLAARVTRSRNPMNTVKAALAALLSQRIPDDIARARGKKLVDVRKVYYGGSVG